MKTVSIADFLTEDEISAAHDLYLECSDTVFASRCAKEIIEPILPEINRKLGQENEPRYLAYCVQYVFNLGSPLRV